MANIIKLVKCDKRIFQAQIEELKLAVESIAMKVFLLAMAASLGCMMQKLIMLGAIMGLVAMVSLIAYGYSRNLARFVVMDLGKREVLTLAIMPKQNQEAGNYQ